MLTTDFVPGSPDWIDLKAPDVSAAADFYGGLFGWRFQSAGPDAGGYGFFQLEGRTVAAAGPITEEEGSPAWTVYFQTPDADATVRAVEQAGGTLGSGPHDVFTAGRTAGLTDPVGARFSIWQPGTIKGLDAASAPGALCWVELETTDLVGALAFYGTVFGWRAEEMQAPGVTYTVLSTADGGEDASFGGVAPLEDGAAAVPPHWQPYFAVADCDAVVARVQELGGRVRTPATTLEGVGRMAELADPSGAAFSVIAGDDSA